MSRISLKLFIAGALLFMATSVSQAQMSQMRLFSPYPDDQFGGGTYAHEGFYGSFGAGVVSISTAPDQTFGYTGQTEGVGTTIGGATDTGTAITTAYNTASQINTADWTTGWTTATEFEVGNQRGHHGWYVKGTVISPQEHSSKGFGAGFTMYDPPTVDIYPYPENETQNINFYVYTGGSTGDGLQQITAKTSIGKLWGIVGLFGSGTSNQSYSGSGSAGGNSSTVSEDSVYVFVPLVLSYDSFEVKSKVNTFSVEAMYNYRFHPFRRGCFEVLGGLRYTEFNEDVDFSGAVTTKQTTSYTNTVVEILQSSNIVSNSGSAVVGQGQNFQQNSQNNDFSVGADLGPSMWNFKADNHLVGPQIGARYTLSNNRWEYCGGGKFFAAFNRQNIRGNGVLGLKAANNQDTNLSYTNGNVLYAPLSAVQNEFNYSHHNDVFSPCFEINLDATWHWTSCVSCKFGYEFLYMGEIARGSATNDFRMNGDGTIFGVKPNRDDYCFDTYVHGAMFTLQINK